MSLPVIPIIKIVAELASTATGIGTQWMKSKNDVKGKDVQSRLTELEASYTKQVELVEGMAKEMSDMAILIQKQIDINNDQKKYIADLKKSVIVLAVFSLGCIMAIVYLILSKP